MRVYQTTVDLSKRSDLISLTVVFLHLLSVLAALYVAVLLGIGFHLIVCWIWFGIAMNSILNLMHECAHLHVFSRRGASQFLGRLILGPLAFADFDGYQKRHWDHHRKLGEEDDPKYVYRSDIHGWRFAIFFLRCLLLIEGFRKFYMQADYRKNEDVSPLASGFWFGRTLLIQALLALSLFLTATTVYPEDPVYALQVAAVSYFGVYFYGLASLTLFTSSLRAIAEHQIGPEQGRIVQQAALRNFSGGLFASFAMGAYGFVHHATHHEDPALPYYRLKERTRELAEMNEAYAPRFTYFNTLISLIGAKRAF